MAEGRFLSRNIAFSEQLGQVSIEADYLFMRMLPHLDRDGRLTGSPTSIRARVCPLRTDITDALVATALAELDQAKLIVWYDVDGQQCVEYPHFELYQVGLRKERETPSKVPASSALGAARIRTAQPLPQSVPDNSGVMTDDSRTPQDIVREVKGSKGKLREVKNVESGDSIPKTRKSKPEPKYPHYPTEICDQLFEAYRRCRGPIEFARFRKETAPLFPTNHAVDDLVHGLEAWGEYVDALPPEKAKWEHASTWVADNERWVRLGAMPLADANGVTERGRLAAGVAA